MMRTISRWLVPSRNVLETQRAADAGFCDGHCQTIQSVRPTPVDAKSDEDNTKNQRTHDLHTDWIEFKWRTQATHSRNQMPPTTQTAAFPALNAERPWYRENGDCPPIISWSHVPVPKRSRCAREVSLGQNRKRGKKTRGSVSDRFEITHHQPTHCVARTGCKNRCEITADPGCVSGVMAPYA